MNYDIDAPAVQLVYGTMIPEHWVEWLNNHTKNLTAYQVIRQRMVELGLSESDIEAMAERAKISTLSQKQRLIAEWFKDDGIPSWNLPAPKARRIMTKGRKAFRVAKEDTQQGKRTSAAYGCWVKLTPSQLEKAKAIASTHNVDANELARVIFTKWLNKQESPHTNHASPQPDQQEG